MTTEHLIQWRLGGNCLTVVQKPVISYKINKSGLMVAFSMCVMVPIFSAGIR